MEGEVLLRLVRRLVYRATTLPALRPKDLLVVASGQREAAERMTLRDRFRNSFLDEIASDNNSPLD